MDLRIAEGLTDPNDKKRKEQLQAQIDKTEEEFKTLKGWYDAREKMQEENSAFKEVGAEPPSIALLILKSSKLLLRIVLSVGVSSKEVLSASASLPYISIPLSRLTGIFLIPAIRASS